MRIFGTCGSDDRDTRRETAQWPHGPDVRRLAARALLFLAACAPCIAGAHTAGAAAVADVMECVAHARMHEQKAPVRTRLVTVDSRLGGAEAAAPEDLLASGQSQDDLPTSDCSGESDARPRMNPARSAQPAGGLHLQITWRQRLAPDCGIPCAAVSLTCRNCVRARHVARTPLTCATATPLARFERAPRGPPATPVASHG